MFEFRYILTQEEYLAYNYYTAWSSPDKRKFRLYYLFRAWFFMTTAQVMYLILADKISNLHFIYYIVIALISGLYAFLTPFSVKRTIRKKVDRMVNENKTSFFEDETILTIGESGIVDRDRLSETSYKWEAIQKVSYTKQAVYLYTNSLQAIVLPNRVVSETKQLKELKQFIDRHLPLSTEVLDQ